MTNKSGSNTRRNSLKSKLSNLRIPNHAEIAAARLCYPPTPPITPFKIEEFWYDSEGDVLMTDNKK